MQDIVQAVERIEKFYQARPRDLFTKLSQHVSLFGSVRLTGLEWFVARSSDTESANDVVWEGGAPVRRGNRRGGGAKTGLFEIAIIRGEFTDFDGNYRFVLSAIDDLESAMRSSGYYDEVSVIKRPLDIESENQISGDASIDAGRRTERAEFAVRVVRQVKLNES